MAEDERRANLERISREDHEAKSALWAAKADYYPEKLDELGLKPMDRFVQYHPNPSRLMKMGITFGHRDLESVAEAMASNKPWAVVSGLNPSGPLHFGHKQVFDELLWMQQQGADVYIPITNDESYVVDKAKSLAKTRRIEYEQFIPSIIAMGFNPKKTHIFVDSDYLDIYNVAMDVSKLLSLNRVFGVFGFGKNEEGENPGTMFYRSAVQIAQILLPQYPEFGGPKPVVVPVGIDQHPYIVLSRDVALKKSFIPPAELVMRFLPGLKGPGTKMSASVVGSSIYLTDSIEVAKQKIEKAYTGGSVSAEFQRKHGGVPEICPIFLLLKYHFLNKEQSDKLYLEYKGGKILNRELKERAFEYVSKYLKKHQTEMKKAKRKIDKFILKKEIK